MELISSVCRCVGVGTGGVVDRPGSTYAGSCPFASAVSLPVSPLRFASLVSLCFLDRDRHATVRSNSPQSNCFPTQVARSLAYSAPHTLSSSLIYFHLALFRDVCVLVYTRTSSQHVLTFNSLHLLIV